jgi:hypothetical protein
MKDKINIYIGTGPGMEEACDALVCSIYENTAEPEHRIQIHLMEAWAKDQPEWRWWHAQPDPRDPDMLGKGYWVTPFSMFRYAIPFVQTEGFAIYLDCDQIVLGDIARLYDYREEGKWAVAANQDGDCVMVMDCAATQNDGNYPPFDQLKGGVADKRDMRKLVAKYMLPKIPEGWNRHSRDYEPGNAQLVHYTEINMQPWQPFPHVEYEPHSNPHAVALWKEWTAKAEAWQMSESA